MSFDYFENNAGDPFGDTTTQVSKKSRGARTRSRGPASTAPWYLLVIGVAGSIGTVVWQFVAPPSGPSVIQGNLFLWLISLFSFLAPIAVFTVLDLTRQLSLSYRSNRDSVRVLRITFVVFGLLASMVQVYALATALSKLLNAA